MWKCYRAVFYWPVVIMCWSWFKWNLRMDLVIVTSHSTSRYRLTITLFSHSNSVHRLYWIVTADDTCALGDSGVSGVIDSTILIVSEILFRLAQHDTLWGQMITVEKRQENCRKLHYDVLYLVFTINGKMFRCIVFLTTLYAVYLSILEWLILE